jgi:hypothetical protein
MSYYARLGAQVLTSFWPRLLYPRSSRDFDTQWKLIWDVLRVDETYSLTLLTWGFMQRPVLRHTDPFRNLYHLKINSLRLVLYLGASFRYRWRMPAVCTLTSVRETWRWEQTLLRFVILGDHPRLLEIGGDSTHAWQTEIASQRKALYWRTWWGAGVLFILKTYCRCLHIKLLFFDCNKYW